MDKIQEQNFPSRLRELCQTYQHLNTPYYSYITDISEDEEREYEEYDYLLYKDPSPGYYRNQSYNMMCQC